MSKIPPPPPPPGFDVAILSEELIRELQELIVLRRGYTSDDYYRRAAPKIMSRMIRLCKEAGLSGIGYQPHDKRFHPPDLPLRRLLAFAFPGLRIKVEEENPGRRGPQSNPDGHDIYLLAKEMLNAVEGVSERQICERLIKEKKLRNKYPVATWIRQWHDIRSVIKYQADPDNLNAVQEMYLKEAVIYLYKDLSVFVPVSTAVIASGRDFWARLRSYREMYEGEKWKLYDGKEWIPSREEDIC